MDAADPLRRDRLPALVHWGFTLALGLLALDAALSDRFITTVTRDFVVNRRLTDLADKLESIHDLLLDAETGQRGFLLSRRSEDLKPYVKARADADAALADLAHLGPDDAAVSSDMDGLTRLARQKLAELDKTVRVAEQGDTATALALIRSDERSDTMHEIRDLVRHRQAAMDNQIRTEDSAIATSLRQARAANWLAALASFLVLSGFAVLLRRHLLARSDAEAKLVELNAKLESDVHARTQELSTLSRHLLTVQEQERASLARDLHDDLGGGLAAMQVELIKMEACVAAGHMPPVEQIRRIRDVGNSAIAFTRRTMNALHPSLLGNLGLAAAVRAHLDEFLERTRLHGHLWIEGQLEDLPPHITIALFRIAQEALTNVAKHARAESVKVTVSRCESRVRLIVADDGIGLAIPTDVRRRGLGLISMRERAYQLGGTFSIRSSSSGEGTTIEVSLPAQGDETPDRATR